MVSLEQGLSLFIEGRQPEAIKHFQIAVPFIKKSIDEESKIFISIFASFSEGVSRLLSGDAHGAFPLLNISSDSIKCLSSFMPHLEKMAIGFKAAAYVALGRSKMNAGDITSAESSFGKAYDQYEQLLALLDPKKESDFVGFVEVYASRIEVAIVFAFLDLQALDLDDMEQRLNSVKEDILKLKYFIEKIQAGPIQKVAGGILILHSVLKDLHSLEKDLIVSRSSLSRGRIEKFQRVTQELFKAKGMAEKAGERGSGVLYTIAQLGRIRRNLLNVAKIGVEDFGRFGGIITFVTFILLQFVFHFTIQPSGVMAISYPFLSLIISLIAGFGYSAIRFIPLLKLYARARKTKDIEGKN